MPGDGSRARSYLQIEELSLARDELDSATNSLVHLELVERAGQSTVIRGL
jgi:hypothetical protein